MPEANDSHVSHVDYPPVDAFKIAAQHCATETFSNTLSSGYTVEDDSLGESAFVIRHRNGFLAHVTEGIGTKPLVIKHAIAAAKIGEFGYDAVGLYANIGVCGAASILNDLATVGAQPLSLQMHLAAAAASWFNAGNPYAGSYYLDRHFGYAAGIALGWREACKIAGCAYGGGETPVLNGIIAPGTIELSGSAVGVMNAGEYIASRNIRVGDMIVLLASSGIHANGLTDARHVGALAGYDALLPDSRPYGVALLDRSVIYSPIVRALIEAGCRPNYAINITGHGWRKLMRAREPFVYQIDRLLPPQPIFRHIQTVAGYDDHRMYGTFNMGAGFALIVRPAIAEEVVDVIERDHGIPAIIAGRVLNGHGAKRVEIKPLGITYEADELQIR